MCCLDARTESSLWQVTPLKQHFRSDLILMLNCRYLCWPLAAKKNASMWSRIKWSTLNSNSWYLYKVRIFYKISFPRFTIRLVWKIHSSFLGRKGLQLDNAVQVFRMLDSNLYRPPCSLLNPDYRTGLQRTSLQAQKSCLLIDVCHYLCSLTCALMISTSRLHEKPTVLLIYLVLCFTIALARA